jgi:putative transposase
MGSILKACARNLSWHLAVLGVGVSVCVCKGNSYRVVGSLYEWSKNALSSKAVSLRIFFNVQSVPRYSVTKIVTMLKSITAREIFKRCPQVKKKLWGGEFWTDGYFASTVGKHGDEATIGKYVKNQVQEYQQLHSDLQPRLF